MKRERDRKYRERKRQEKLNVAVSASPSLGEQYGADWVTPLKKRMIDIIRTELKLRNRLRAAEEMRQIEAEAVRRFNDTVHFANPPEFSTFEEVEEFAKLTRKEVFVLFGGYKNKSTDGILEYAIA
jgi:hypothetical protein